MYSAFFFMLFCCFIFYFFHTNEFLTNSIALIPHTNPSSNTYFIIHTYNITTCGLLLLFFIYWLFSIFLSFFVRCKLNVWSWSSWIYCRAQQEEGSYAGYQLAYEVKKLLYAFYLIYYTIPPLLSCLFLYVVFFQSFVVCFILLIRLTYRYILRL